MGAGGIWTEISVLSSQFYGKPKIVFKIKAFFKKIESTEVLHT